jgi:hypothetical protein
MKPIDIVIILLIANLLLTINNHFKLKTIIMTNAEILALLEEANTTTNEIAADLQDLIDNAGVSPEVAEKLTAHVNALKAVASTHTPGGA